MGVFLPSAKPLPHWTLYTPASLIVFQSTSEVIISFDSWKVLLFSSLDERENMADEAKT